MKFRRLTFIILLTHAFGLTVFVYFVSNRTSLGTPGSFIGESVLSYPASTATVKRLENYDSDQYYDTTGCRNNTIGMPTGHRLGTVRDMWQLVDDDKNAYVFSAYLDEGGRQVRVIGVVVVGQISLTCQLWYDGDPSRQMAHTVAKVTRLTDGSRRYVAAFVMCPLPDSRIPTAVSLVAGTPCTTPQNLITVRNIEPPAEVKYKFTVCVSPLNFRYSRAYELVEWVELNRILGAEHFVFYNYSTGPNVDKVMSMYMDRGLVSVVQWDLPMSVDKWPPTREIVDVNYFAQSAAINDCLRRTRWNSEYLVFIDLDEFIIPHKEVSHTWLDMLREQPPKAAYIFMSSFFRKEWGVTITQYEGKELAIKYRLVTLLQLKREDRVFGPGLRSKYMVRPSLVETVGVHEIFRYGSNQSGVNVPPDIGLVHHYRSWENPGDKVPRRSDDTALKYTAELVENVKSVWSGLRGVEMDRPIA